MKCRVVTYNILSSKLCNTTYFPKCDPLALISDHRYNLIIQKLLDEVLIGSIICLQEVSLEWYGKLFSFFGAHKYHFISCNYGNYFDGFMGVATAVPMCIFNITECEIRKVSDTITWPRQKSSKFINWHEWDTTGVNVFSPWVVPSINVNIQLELKDIKVAQKRLNQIIMLRLVHKITHESLIVGNYHMPCVFNRPIVMHLHLAMATNYLFQFSKNEVSHNTPVVFLGDFNMQPNSDAYELITTGKLPPCGVRQSRHEKDMKSAHVLKTISFCIHAPMRSAYKVFGGHEPAFTNYSHTNRGVFRGTIDYIWISPEVNVDNVISTPLTTNNILGPLPTLEEPSDHLLLAANISIKYH